MNFHSIHLRSIEYRWIFRSILFENFRSNFHIGKAEKKTKRERVRKRNMSNAGMTLLWNQTADTTTTYIFSDI